MNRSIGRLVGLLLASGLTLAACTSAATPTPAAGGGGGGAGVTVATATSPTLGVYLTGTGGMTLYILTKDAPNQSTCTGTCATNWPPFTVATGGAPPGGGGG